MFSTGFSMDQAVRRVRSHQRSLFLKLGLGLGVAVLVFASLSHQGFARETQRAEMSSAALQDLAQQICSPGKVLEHCIDWSQRVSSARVPRPSSVESSNCESMGYELLRNCGAKLRTQKIGVLAHCALQDAPKRFGLKVKSDKACHKSQLARLKEEA